MTEKTSLQRNRDQYEHLVTLADHWASRGDTERVLAAAAVAANSAWMAPMGLLNDPRLEGLIVSAVAERNGRIADLRGTERSLLGRARALRHLMNQVDLVVTHAHPYDSIVIAAANLPGVRPPIIFDDHADHTYWLGLSSADFVASNRARAQVLAREMRGVPEGRLGLLPVPIEPLARRTDRAVMRARLGLRREHVLAVCVAGAPKMRPVWGEGFDTVIGDALDANPNLVVVLVGPSADEPQWQPLAQRHRQRLFAVGYTSDVEPVFAAADLYLDSYPVSGGTALLEAAAYGLPVLRMPTQPGYLAFYEAHFPPAAIAARPAQSRSAYLSALSELVAQPRLRREQGNAARRAVLDLHCGDRWVESMEALYVRARSVPAVSLDEFAPAESNPEYGELLVAFTQAGAAGLSAEIAGRVVQDALDDEVRFDLRMLDLALPKDRFSVRLCAGWEERTAQLARLTRLTATDARLAVSLPLSRDDDGTGAASVAHLSSALSANGLDVDRCGDIALDEMPPVPPALISDVELSDPSLDRIERYLGCARPGATETQSVAIRG